MEGGDDIIGANQAGKCACSLLNCISVTDDSETAYSEFDTFSTLVRGVMWIFNPRGCVSTARKRCRSQKSISTQRNGVGTGVRHCPNYNTINGTVSSKIGLVGL